MHAKNLSLAQVNVPRYAIEPEPCATSALGRSLTLANEDTITGKNAAAMWGPVAALFLVARLVVTGPVQIPDSMVYDF